MKYILTIFLALLFIQSDTAFANESDQKFSDLSDSISLPVFKGECLKMRGKLNYEGGQWVCSKKKKDNNETPGEHISSTWVIPYPTKK